jgi:hypothetical protein
MAKGKIEIRSEKPRVRFSRWGVPYTRVEDIFHSEKGQKIISRMAVLRPQRDIGGRLKEDD